MIQPGDKEYLDFQEESFKKIKEHKCHRLSKRGVDGSFCADFKTYHESDLAFKGNMLATSITLPQSSANIANNVRCVAESITSNLWQGHFGDSALNYGIFGICVFLFFSILP